MLMMLHHPTASAALIAWQGWQLQPAIIVGLPQHDI
jgi:hypothetical protein